MRRYLSWLLPVLLPAFAWAAPAPSVYVCAHPDDCFLFMSPNLYDDIVSGDGKKVVVVYLTSGDAGLPFDKKSEGATKPYPSVRELASIDATQWVADIGKEHVRAQLNTATVAVHGHNVTRVSYANTVSYFLRLPDGNMYGDGFERYGHQSLQKFKKGEIAQMNPIDGQVAYQGWGDLVAVLSGILARETAGEAQIALHISEPDTQLNTADHSDHTTGASGVLEAIAQLPAAGHCYTVYKHIDYSIAQKEPNLEGVGLQNKSGSFAVLTATQRHFLDYHNWDVAHLSYLTRNYYTTVSMPNGCTKN